MSNKPSARSPFWRSHILLLAVLAFTLLPAAVIWAAPNLVATKTARLVADANEDGKISPGDTLEYEIVVRNTGTEDVTSVVLSDTLDPNTELVAGSLSITPLAYTDVFTTTGNISIDVATPGVLGNDQDLDGGALQAVAISSGATAQGGRVSLAADGGFTYTPLAGFEGKDSFTYSLTDDEGDTDTGTVTITVSKVIWFINNAASGANLGTLEAPFTSLAAFQAINDGAGNHPASGDAIFLYSGQENYTGGVKLLNGQTLIGQGATGTSLANLLGIHLEPYSRALPSINGGRPTVVNSAGNGIELASGNTLRGLNVNAASGFAIRSKAGSNVGSLTIRDASINNSAGGGLLVEAGGTLDVVFTSLSSSGGTNGIALSSANGSLTADSGALSGASGPAFYANGGSANITYGGSITSAAGRPALVENRDTGGTITLSGTISATGQGLLVQNSNNVTLTFSGANKTFNTGANNAVTLTNNAGATIHITGGGLAITTTSGKGFEATGGGTVSVTGTANTIQTTTGTALTVTNTNIGLDGLNFRSLASSGAASGIVLDSTGTTGSLTITGTGSAGSGGTIANSTGTGIRLKDTRAVNLAWMNVQGSGDDGIYGENVTGLILKDCKVVNNGNSSTDDGIELRNLWGTSTWTNLTVTGSAHNNISINNTSGTLTALAVTGATIGGNRTLPYSANGFLIDASGTAQVSSIAISASRFADNYSTGILANAGSTAILADLTVQDSQFADNHTAFQAAQFDTAVVTFKFLNNSIINPARTGPTDGASHAIVAGSSFTASGGTLNGRIQGNTIGNPAITGSGSAMGNGMRIILQGRTTGTLLVDDNAIRQTPFGRGIEATSQSGFGLDITITNNDVDPQDASGFPLAAIYAASDNTGTGALIRADIRGNQVPAPYNTWDAPDYDGMGPYLWLGAQNGGVTWLVKTSAADTSCTEALLNANTGSAEAAAACTLSNITLRTAP